MYYIIVNPKSRSGGGSKLWLLVHRQLKLQQAAYQVFFTRYRGHAITLAQKITGNWNPKDILVVLGGDGTLNEVASGICPQSDVTLGYIPTGSGNDFARSMGISTDCAKALRCILNPTDIKCIDIGVSQHPAFSRNFVISSGIGFDAAITHEVAASHLKGFLNRIHMGKLIYTLIALKQLSFHQSFSLQIEMDEGRKHFYKNTYFAVAMNQCCEGGGLKFCPDARPSDGLLDIMIISDISKLKILCLLPTAYFGRHVNFRGVHLLRCKHAVLTADSPQPIHRDGEPDGIRNRLSVSLEPLALKIITQ